MAQVSQLSKTVEQIYAAAADGSLWRTALSAIEDFTGSAGCVFHVIPHNGPEPKPMLGANAAELFPPSELAEWQANFMSNCPRMAAGQRWPERPFITDYMIFSEAEMDRNPSYNWWDKRGLRYFIGSRLPDTPRHMLAWSLQRTRRQKHVQSEDIERFELIRPHLSQAAAIADSLDTLTAHRRFSDAMLDALPQAIFGFDETGALLFANARGDRMLGSGDAVFLEAGRLVAAMQSQRPQLNALIAQALSGGPGGAMRLFRPDGRRPRALRVAPIVNDDEQRLLRPKVMIIVSDLDPTDVVDEQLLRDLYNFTPAEARTAVALVDGHSIQSAAQSLRISGETVRSHLKSVFRKVGVSRQQDLIRILTELEAISLTPPDPSPE